MAKTEIIISAQDKTKQAFNSVRGSLNGLSGYANTLNNTLGALGGLSTILGASSFTAFLKGGIDTLDMLGDLSDRTGVAASTLAGFQLVAAQSDTSLEALGKGINKLSIFMAENADQAKKLGLSAKDPAEAFIQLSDLLSAIEDDQKRAAVANKILGKSYQELLPALLQGGDALRNQIDAGKEYAGVTEQSVQQAQAFNNQMDKLGVMAKGLGVSLATDLLPNLTDITAAMKLAADEAGTWTALWVGLGGLGDLFFNGTKIHQARTAVEELTAEVQKLETLSHAKPVHNAYTERYQEFYDNKNAQRISKNAEALNVARQKLQAAQAGLDELINPKPAKKEPKKENAAVSDFVSLPKGTKKIGKSEVEKAAEEAARFVESLQKQVAVLDLNKSQLLAYDAAQLKLNATQKQTVNGLIDVIATREQLAKDDEAWAEQAKLNTQFDDEQLRMMEDASAAEIEQQEARQRSYEEMAAQLALTNEDLNIDLIASDKARAKAQLDLEHARAIARIESMGLEADEAQNLIEQETERYELSRKKIEQGLTKTKSISEELGVTFKSAFEDAVVGGEGFGDVLKGLEQDIIRLAARKTILDPLLKAFDQLLQGGSDGSGGVNSLLEKAASWVGSFFTKNATGNVYNSPSLSQFSGGVYNSPQAFTFAKGAGIFGEAGPEAIMPLSRGADGKLGVKANGGGGANITVNLIESPGNGGQVNQRQEGENITLEIMVEKIEGMLSKNISKGRGIAGTIERQYGLSRAAGSY